MCWRFVVWPALVLVLTIGDGNAIHFDCNYYGCTLYEVRTNIDNEIDFPRSFNRTAAQELTKIEIKRSKFRYFPSNFFKVMPNVEFLTARDGELVALNSSIFGTHSSFDLTGIEALDFENNLLTTLEAKSFIRTRNLARLTLARNRLSHIDALAFYGLAKLKQLILSDNRLTNLDDSLFKPLPLIVHIFLKNNQLQEFNLDILIDNSKLVILDLAGNGLTTLQATLENNVIDDINLSRNQLQNISALAKMKFMHTLDVSDNKAVELISDDFYEMDELSDLLLDGVDLQRKLNNKNQFLKQLPQLLTLSIGRNELTSFDQFPIFPEVSKLVVDGNKISDLDVNGLKAQFLKLREINLEKNPWNCKVLTNVVDQLKKSDISLIYRSGNRPVIPAYIKSVEHIECEGKVVGPNVEANLDVSTIGYNNIDERPKTVTDDLVCGRPNLPGSQYIYGGQKAVRGAWPWLVAVHKKKDGQVEFLCGGSLISNKLVISAAHCIEDLTLREALLYIGSHDIRNTSNTDFQRRGAQQFVIHPDYFRSGKTFSDADICLIILAQPINYTDYIKPICLWPTDEADLNIVAQKGVVAGWGFDSSDQGTATPNFIEMPVVSTLDCVYDDLSYLKITSNRTLCIGEKNGQGPCHGDSGSGFVMKRAEKWVLRGIVSAGLPDVVKHSCDLNKYVVLSDTVKFIDWILLYMKI